MPPTAQPWLPGSVVCISTSNVKSVKRRPRITSRWLPPSASPRPVRTPSSAIQRPPVAAHRSGSSFEKSSRRRTLPLSAEAPETAKSAAAVSEAMDVVMLVLQVACPREDVWVRDTISSPPLGFRRIPQCSVGRWRRAPASIARRRRADLARLPRQFSRAQRRLSGHFAAGPS